MCCILLFSSHPWKEIQSRLHKDLGMSVTPKVHLMWKHVKYQMGFPGGLGEKREDWVEHQHQITRRLRTQFNSTKDINVRTDAMAR